VADVTRISFDRKSGCFLWCPPTPRSVAGVPVIDITRKQPEFSRRFPFDQIGEETLERALEATAEECAALAARLGIVGIEAFGAKFRLERKSGGAVIEASGSIEAEISQTCVITTQPLRNHIEEPFSLLLDPGPKSRSEAREVVLDVNDQAALEPLEGDALDLGEIAAQQLAVAIDPYPRAKDVNLERSSWGPTVEADEGRKNPFGVLRKLKLEG